MRKHYMTMIVVLLSLWTMDAHAQLVSGNNNGNAGSGTGNSNGNGNGNGNGSNNSFAGGSANNLVTVRQRRQAPSVVPPGLAAAGIESCLGSTSVGGAGPGFGITIGGTMVDRGCNLRLFSRTLDALGHRVAATQILCNDPEVAQALMAEGIRCQVGVGAELQQAADLSGATRDADHEADTAGAYDVAAAEQDREGSGRRSRRSHASVRR